MVPAALGRRADGVTGDGGVGGQAVIVERIGVAACLAIERAAGLEGIREYFGRRRQPAFEPTVAIG